MSTIDSSPPNFSTRMRNFEHFDIEVCLRLSFRIAFVQGPLRRCRLMKGVLSVAGPAGSERRNATKSIRFARHAVRGVLRAMDTAQSLTGWMEVIRKEKW